MYALGLYVLQGLTAAIFRGIISLSLEITHLTPSRVSVRDVAISQCIYCKLPAQRIRNCNHCPLNTTGDIFFRSSRGTVYEIGVVNVSMGSFPTESNRQVCHGT